jgi:hypothetical protein
MTGLTKLLFTTRTSIGIRSVPLRICKELDQTSQQQLMLIRLAFVKDVLAAQAKAVDKRFGPHFQVQALTNTGLTIVAARHGRLGASATPAQI